jgi:hypothetical protein
MKSEYDICSLLLGMQKTRNAFEIAGTRRGSYERGNHS